MYAIKFSDPSPLCDDTLDGGTFAGVITLADGRHCAVVLLKERSEKRLTWDEARDWARSAADMLREHYALLQAQPEASCMVERGETVDLTLIADPVRRAAFEAYHNTHSGHYDRLCAAIEAATKAQPAEAILRLQARVEELEKALRVCSTTLPGIGGHPTSTRILCLLIDAAIGKEQKA